MVYSLGVIEKEIFRQFCIKVHNIIKEEVGMIVHTLSLEYPIEPFTVGIHLGSTGIRVIVRNSSNREQSIEVLLEL